MSLLSATDERACDANSIVVFCVCVSHGAVLPKKVTEMNRDFSLPSFSPVSHVFFLFRSALQVSWNVTAPRSFLKAAENLSGTAFNMLHRGIHTHVSVCVCVPVCVSVCLRSAAAE